MSDITERLRLLASEGPDSGLMSAGDLIAAADEIERLRAALRRLCSAADAMAHICNSGICEEATEEAEKLLAREALGDKL